MGSRRSREWPLRRPSTIPLSKMPITRAPAANCVEETRVSWAFKPSPSSPDARIYVDDRERRRLHLPLYKRGRNRTNAPSLFDVCWAGRSGDRELELAGAAMRTFLRTVAGLNALFQIAVGVVAISSPIAAAKLFELGRA